MAIWSYACRPCDGSGATWHVSVDRVAEMPPETRFVRVKVGDDWRCAVLVFDSMVEIEAQLLREVIPSSAEDCPSCVEAELAGLRTRSSEPKSGGSGEDDSRSVAGSSARDASGRTVQAAAISLRGVRFVVVLVGLDLVRSPGEAGMAIDTLAPGFGGVPIVLVGQDEEGAPHYHGDPELVGMLAGVPLERMPWREYPLA